MAIDPVCGMTVDEQTAPAKAQYNGTTYYFCAPGCKRTFEKDPEAVLHGGPKGMSSPAPQLVMMMPARQKPAPSVTTVAPSKTAPSVKPVSLTIPIEGMSCASCVAKIEHGLSAVPGVSRAAVNLATEKATVEYQQGATDPTAIAETIRSLGYTPIMPVAQQAESPDVKEARKQAAYRDLQKRFLVAAALSVPVMILGMSEHLGLSISPIISAWLQLLLTTPIQFWAGRQFYKGAIAVGRHGSADMNTLIALGTSAAYGYSAAATIVPSAFTVGGFPPLYFDSAAAIVTLILLGRVLEVRARGRASEAIRRLIGLQPRQARVIRGGREMDIPIEEVVVGDLVVVRPGEKVPVDGVIEEGASALDESMLTGESLPVDEGPGPTASVGTLNRTGSFRFRAAKVGADTALANIVRLVEEAQGSKPPVARFVDRVAGLFVPIVIAIAVLTFGLWYAFGPERSFLPALLNCVAVLVVACPCALGLATPTSIMVGIGRGAEEGILIRSGEALEQARGLTTVVLDKTGTITLGQPMVKEVVLQPHAPHAAPWDRQKILQIAASAEQGTEHPVGQAIVQAARAAGLTLRSFDHFAAVPG